MRLAFSQYGEWEWKGKADNPEIIKYFDEIGFDGKSLKDETAWCSAFSNWVMKTSGKPYTGKLNARSWLDIGTHTQNPRFGDIVVLWRGSKDSWMGHVGFFIREKSGWIYILGGNQGNQVNIKAYPKKRLLQYRKI